MDAKLFARVMKNFSEKDDEIHFIDANIDLIKNSSKSKLDYNKLEKFEQEKTTLKNEVKELQSMFIALGSEFVMLGNDYISAKKQLENAKNKLKTIDMTINQEEYELICLEITQLETAINILRSALVDAVNAIDLENSTLNKNLTSKPDELVKKINNQKQIMIDDINSETYIRTEIINLKMAETIPDEVLALKLNIFELIIMIRKEMLAELENKLVSINQQQTNN